MSKDPIIEEVRKVREQHAARFDYNLAAICNDLREEQERSGRKFVRLQPQKPQPVAAPLSSQRLPG